MGRSSTYGLNIRSWAVLVFLARLAAWQCAQAQGQSMLVSSGRDLAAAFADPDVQVAILVADIELQESDWDGFSLPIPLLRNFTILGNNTGAPGIRPALDFRFQRAKVRLGDGVVLALRFITLVNFVAGNFNVAPGVDLLARCLEGDRAMMLAVDCIGVLRLCYPADAYAEVVRTAPRPAWLPGQQLGLFGLPQPDCVNASGMYMPGRGDVPPERRCWGQLGLFNDTALEAYDLDNQRQIPKGYATHIVNTVSACLEELTWQCLNDLGTVGCITKMLASTLAPPPPFGARSPSPPPTPAPPLPLPLRSHGAGMRGRRLAALLAGLLGGLAMVTATACVLLIWARRRLRERRSRLPARPQSGAKQSAQNGTAGQNGADSPSPGSPPTAGAAAAGAATCAAAAGDAAAVKAVAGGAVEVVVAQRRCATAAGAPPVEGSGDGGGDGEKKPCAGAEPEPRATAASTPSWATSTSGGRGAAIEGLQWPGPVPEFAEIAVVLDSRDGDSGGCGAAGIAAGPIAGGFATGFQEVPMNPAANRGTNAAARRAESDVISVRRVHQGGMHGGLTAMLNGSVADPLAPVTPMTPPRADLRLDAMPGREVTLLPTVLGKGAFGRVVEGVYQGRTVAVKVLLDTALEEWGIRRLRGEEPGGLGGAGSEEASVSAGKDDAGDGGRRRGGRRHMMNASEARLAASLSKEVEVLGRCRHPNVVSLLAACLEPPRFCLVMERMETSLDKMLYGHGPCHLLPMQEVIAIAVNVARGLEYLHPTIVHRDLKPGNVLVNSPGTPRVIAKLSDFGLSRLRSTVVPTLNPEDGTPEYMAPEQYMTSNNVVTHKADVYSFGVLLWAMLSGQKPWAGLSMVVIATRVTLYNERPPLTAIPLERCTSKLHRLILQCWEADPERRPAAAELVKELLLVREQLSLDVTSLARVGAGLASSTGSTCATSDAISVLNIQAPSGAEGNNNNIKQ